MTGLGVKKRLLPGVALVIFLGLTPGCKRSGSSANPAASKAFDSAAPELKSAWQFAVAADSTNGYSAAYSTLLQIYHPRSLTPEQLEAVGALMQDVNRRLQEGLQKGDPAAQKAAQEIAHMDKNGRIFN